MIRNASVNSLRVHETELHGKLTIGHPCIWKVSPALLPQKSVLKIICWLVK
jgi:hypothetical protein